MTPYGKAIPIINSNRPAYVFPEASASITQAQQNRFRVLKDIFQRNVETSSELRDHSQKISYELRMCGSLEDASASVLVCCPPDQLTEIESLFKQPHIRSQYEPKITTPSFVPLGLYFWPEVNIWLALHELAVVIPEELDSSDSIPDAVAGLMPWSLRILEGDRGVQHTATMGCVLQVGRDRFGLTTAHVFNHPPVTVPEYHGGGRDSYTGGKKYDRSIEEEGMGKLSRGIQPLQSTNGLGRTAKLGQRQVHAPPPFEDTSTWMEKHANLDWAAFELVSNDDRLQPNATESEALPLVDHLPQKCTDVLIITSYFPGIPATLYNVPSYIGGAKGSPAAEVWTVGCLSKEACESQPFHNSGATSWKLTPYLPAIRKGDSGSIVVDARSGELYGMVVAANPFGDIHISPLVAVLAQVKGLFQNEHACVLTAPRYFHSTTFGPTSVNTHSKATSYSGFSLHALGYDLLRGHLTHSIFKKKSRHECSTLAPSSFHPC